MHLRTSPTHLALAVLAAAAFVSALLLGLPAASWLLLGLVTVGAAVVLLAPSAADDEPEADPEPAVPATAPADDAAAATVLTL